MHKLHIISFDVPYPPKYGGVIDVYFKIKELNAVGIAVYLHVFSSERKHEEKLRELCEDVFFYERGSALLSFVTILPYRVKSRVSSALVSNVQKVKAPVLFEGLHSAYYLSKKIFAKNYLRAHNVEHHYFFGLAKSEKNVLRKVFFYVEALKLKAFEKNLHHADGIFSIAPLEQEYFAKNFGKKAHYIPVFHDSSFASVKTVQEKFVLWHGDLRVSDNIKTVGFLIEVYKSSSYRFKIASSILPKRIEREIEQYDNIDFVFLDDHDEILQDLFSKAQINVLYTYQNTGIKLKLLNALYKGKFVIGNHNLLMHTGLEDLCELANSKQEILAKTKLLYHKNFTTAEAEKRKKHLAKFNPEISAKQITAIIFK